MPLFLLGQIVATPSALEALEHAAQSPATFLDRHVSGHWGEVCNEDKQANNEALEKGFRILSAYHTRTGTKLWIITEADRSATTILLPKEY